MQYFQHVSRLGNLVRAYGFDLLIVLLAIAAMLQLVFREDAEGAPSTTLWFCVPAAALMALPLVARRQFPFAAAAAFWLIAVGVSFVDGRLVPFLFTIFVVGMAASFLLGSLRDARDAWMGLVIVLGGAAIVLYNLPTHSIGQLVFYPLLFGVCWLAGFALHERAEQAEAAEARATQAEREREVGRAHRRRRGARAHCSRAPRRRRARGQRHGAPGRRRPAQAA